MANIKITDLNAYSDPDSTDVLPIVDVGADETKKVSIADLMENAGAGTEALPGIAFDGDPDTGIYRPGADQIAISTGGTQRLAISDTGAVTIPGNLTVQGTTTFIDSQTLQVEDKNIEMGVVTTPTDSTADGGGITLKGATDKTINWVNATDAWTSSERFSVPLGAQATPSLTFTGDPNTGIYSPGADQVAISTGGTDRLFIDANGNAALGTSSPNNYSGFSTFTLNGSNGGEIDFEVGGTLTADIFGNSAGLHLGTRLANDVITFSTNSGTFSEKVRIDSSGRVGIGTSSPVAGAQLTVAGSALAVTGQNLDHSANSIRIGQEGSGAAQIRCYGPNTSTNGSLTFKMSRSDGSNSQDVVIDTSGNVGINTTVPGSYGKLAVFGAASNVGQNISGFFYNPDAASSTICIQDNTSASGGGIGSVGNNLVLYSNSGVNLAERARIDSSGRLGIGTSSPGAKVDINQGSSYGPGNGLRLTNAAGNRWDISLDQVSMELGFAYNSNNRVTIKNDGKVGIGTTSPGTFGSLLEVNGMGVFTANAGGDLFRFKNTSSTASLTGYIADNNQDSIGIIAYDSSYALSFGTNNTERFRIDSSGRVGIGTSSPGHLLHLNKSGSSCEMRITSSNSDFLIQAGDAGDDGLHFYDVANTSYRMMISNAGRVGIGTTSPQVALQLGSYSGNNQLAITSQSTNGTGALFFGDGTGTDLYRGYIQYYHVNDSLEIGTAGSGRVTVDSSGRLLVGTSTVTTTASSATNNLVAVESTNNYSGVSFTANTNSNNGSYLVLKKSRGTSPGSTTVVQNGDEIGNIFFEGTDGSASRSAAAVRAFVDGTPGAGDMPGRLSFWTTADGASSPTERMRINSSGYLKVAYDGNYKSSTAAYHEFTGDAANSYDLRIFNDKATPLSQYILDLRFNSSTPNNGNARFIDARDSTAGRFYVLSNGGIGNYQSNDSNLCDEREKKNIETLDSTWSCLKNWDLKKFHYNEDADTDDKRYGVIAQQVAPHCPEVITEWVKQKAEDAVLDEDGNVVTPAVEEVTRMGVKEQQMMWMAIKALQEAQTRIEELEAKVAALEAN